MGDKSARDYRCSVGCSPSMRYRRCLERCTADLPALMCAIRSTAAIAKRRIRGSSMEAGYLGVGAMGQPMAHKLLDAGHSLTVYDISEAAMQPLLDEMMK